MHLDAWGRSKEYVIRHQDMLDISLGFPGKSLVPMLQLFNNKRSLIMSRRYSGIVFGNL